MSRTRFFHSHKKSVARPLIIRDPAGQELDLKLVPHGQLNAMVDGRGDENTFLTVTLRVLVGAALIEFADESGIETLENEIFIPALTSLISVGERYQRLGKFGLNGDELTSIKEALNLTDDLQTVCTRRQQLEKYQKVQNYVGGIEYTLNKLRHLIGKEVLK